MSTTRNFRFGWLVLCLSFTLYAYAGSDERIQQTGQGGQDGLTWNGVPYGEMNHNTSSLMISNSPLPGQPGLPGNKFGDLGLSGGVDQKQMGPPLPPIPSPIPEPNVLLDIGVALTAFATMWSFRVRRSG